MDWKIFFWMERFAMEWCTVKVRTRRWDNRARPYIQYYRNIVQVAKYSLVSWAANKEIVARRRQRLHDKCTSSATWGIRKVVGFNNPQWFNSPEPNVPVHLQTDHIIQESMPSLFELSITMPTMVHLRLSGQHQERPVTALMSCWT